MMRVRTQERFYDSNLWETGCGAAIGEARLFQTKTTRGASVSKLEKHFIEIFGLRLRAKLERYICINVCGNFHLGPKSP